MTGEPYNSPSQPPFDQAIRELQQIIEQIETGGLGLEQSVEHYERGRALVEQCRRILEETERRIGSLNTESDPAEERQS